MANPLSILAGLAGGLSTIGAQGASGGLEGQVEGEKLKRKFATEELENRLRVLDMIHKGQAIEQAGQPTYQFHGDQIYRMDPRGAAPAPVGQVPETPAQKSAREAHDASTKLHGAQTEQVGVPTDPTHAWQKKLGDAIARGDTAAADQAMTILNRFAQIHAGTAAPKIHFDKTTDAQGRVTYLVGSADATGKWTVQQIPLGAIGHPPASARAGTPAETTTTTTRITPRKEISDTIELGQVQRAVEQTVNEIASNQRIQGWMQPGALVRIEGYSTPVRREDVIADRLFKRTGVHVGVRWDPAAKRWVLVRAWTGGDREPIETVKRVGPPSQPAARDDEED